MSSVARTFGRYDLLLELSKGPFGSLWIARETGTSSDVVMLRRWALEGSDPAAASTVAAAAEWAESVRGPGVLDAIATIVSDGEVGLVTRDHPGEPLRSLLRLANFKRRAFVPGAALRVALDVLSGLRTLSKAARPRHEVPATVALLPDSVVIGTDGRSFVIDAGIGAAARRSPALAANPDVAAYFAPEELEPDAALDERTSVFSVGVLLWEMMSGGRRLFSGNAQDAIVDRIKNGSIPRLDAARPPGGGPIPKGVADLVARALEREPERRFDGIEPMLAAIEELGSAVVGTAAEVSAIVTALAGNALTARERSIQRATDPAANEHDHDETAPANASSAANAAAAPVAPEPIRKRTLLGMAPAKPSRMPSIPDASDVERVSHASDAQKPVTPPLPKSLDEEHAELTPATAAARLSLLKPPKPATSRKPAPRAPATSAPAAESSPLASASQARPAAEDDASAEDRRLLDALTLESAPSERSPAPPPAAAKPFDERDSVTPSESLTASKDSAPPPTPSSAGSARRTRWIALGSAAALIALAAAGLAFGRRSPRTAVSADAVARPSASTPVTPGPTPPVVPAATAAPSATETAAPSSTETTAPSSTETAEPPAASAAASAAPPSSADALVAPKPARASTTTPAPVRHAVPKPAKRPVRFTPPDI